MRSLEKVAINKGLIQPDVIQKTASVKQADYQPTSDLMGNVVKLCQGLRQQGQDKIASELESNFLHYKQAQTMYDTHGETGEDLIHSAHPKGSYKLDGVKSDEAVVEDILDHHLKMLEVVEKTPTGKLTSASLINKVKLALGENRATELNQAIQKQVDRIKAKLTEVLRKAGPEIIGSSLWEATLQSTTKDTELDTLMDLQRFIDNLEQRIKPGLLHSGAHQQTWAQVNGLLATCKEIVQDAIRLSNEYNEEIGKAENIVGDPVNKQPVNEQRMEPFFQKGSELISKLQSFITNPNVIKNPKALQWIPIQINEIKEVMQSNKYDRENEMNTKEKEVNDFESQVVNVKT